MPEILTLTGQLSFNPTHAECGVDSDLSTVVNLQESLSIAAKQMLTFSLSSDLAFPIDLTTTPNVNMLYIDVSSKVKLTITTADGATQVVPVDPVMFWISSTVPITALSITRLAGTDTNVKVILGDNV